MIILQKITTTPQNMSTTGRSNATLKRKKNIKLKTKKIKKADARHHFRESYSKAVVGIYQKNLCNLKYMLNTSPVPKRSAWKIILNLRYVKIQVISSYTWRQRTGIWKILNNFLSNLHCKEITNIHCVNSIQVQSFSGPYFPTFGQNTERYRVSL